MKLLPTIALVCVVILLASTVAIGQDIDPKTGQPYTDYTDQTNATDEPEIPLYAPTGIWELHLSNHVIWIGEDFRIDIINGTADTWVRVEMVREDGNLSFYRDAITDVNGTCYFEYNELYTEHEGRYAIYVRIESNDTVIMMDSVEINYDDIYYLFLLIGKIEDWAGEDFDNYNPMTDTSYPEEMQSLNAQQGINNEKTDKAFKLWIFTVCVWFIPIEVLIWLFWDKIKEQWDKKAKLSQIPSGFLLRGLTINTPRLDQQGLTLHNRTPTFDDGLTKQARERQRKRKLRKLKQKVSIVELSHPEDMADGTAFLGKWFNRASSEIKKAKMPKKKKGKPVKKPVKMTNEEMIAKLERAFLDGKITRKNYDSNIKKFKGDD